MKKQQETAIRTYIVSPLRNRNELKGTRAQFMKILLKVPLNTGPSTLVPTFFYYLCTYIPSRDI